ncbi:MAG TPA: tellurite resistance/C4-dicarboxylate transporter family protein [Actinomycetota bacterium]|nr:tellurite resistance/C4-dicarboxylate transporter family protein [Actinomycetota bacterium]
MSVEPAAPPRSPIAALFPGSFALVMATGIVSIAALQQRLETIADVLFWLNAAFYVALWGLTILRVARYPRFALDDLKTHQRGAGFLTIVAGTNVLGSQIVLLTTWTGLAFALWILGIVGWLGLTYAFLTAVTVSDTKPGLAEGIGGVWLLLVVSTESIGVLGALLAPSVDATEGVLLIALLAHLVGLMLYLLVIGLIFYRWTFFPLRGEQVTPPYWINMGALAITTVGGATLISASESWSVLEGLEPFLSGTTILAWGFATWWIPLLIAVGVWKHGVQRVPIRYDPQYWSLVFPLGMYSVATFRLGAGIDLGIPAWIATTAFWVALAAWAVTAVGLVASARAVVRR